MQVASRLRSILSPGDCVAFLTWDLGRVQYIFDLNRERFESRYMVDVYGYVYSEASLGVIEKLYVIATDVDGSKRKISVKVDQLFKKIIPQSGTVLLVVNIAGERARIRSLPDLPTAYMKRIAVAILVETIEDIPVNWQPHLTRIEDAYFADDEEVRNILGEVKNPKIFKGLTIAELKKLAGTPPNLWEKTADTLRNIRLMLYNVRKAASRGIEELAIDSYFRGHVMRHGGELGKRIIFTGPPGSGKTVIAKALACQFFTNTYILDAGSLMAHENQIYEVLLTLQYMSKIAIIVNEFEHLASATPRYRTKLLNFLEQRYPIWLAGTVVDVKQLLSPTSNQELGILESEMLRPGRIDEVIPVPPPFEPATRLQMVEDIAGELGVRLQPWEAKRIAYAAPLLYPADYLKLVQRYVSEGPICIAQFRDTYNPEARAEHILKMLDTCRSLGNTSEQLIQRIERLVEKAA